MIKNYYFKVSLLQSKLFKKMLVIFLCLLTFNKEIFGCEVLYENGTEEHKKIVEDLENVHYFFVVGYSSVFGENSFVDSRINNEVPFMTVGQNSDIYTLNVTSTELDGDWTDLDSFYCPRQPGIFVFYKQSKAKKKAIILHVCELSKYFPKAPLMVRNISFLFYFAEDKSNDTEIEGLVGKYYHNVTVLPKYSKYKNFCDIVNYTFNGCPAENSEKSDYTFLWIFLFASAAVLYIISEMSCKQCLEPKRNRIEPKPIRNRTGAKANRNRTGFEKKPKNVRTQTEPSPNRNQTETKLEPKNHSRFFTLTLTEETTDQKKILFPFVSGKNT
jgi:hypothetical protein